MHDLKSPLSPLAAASLHSTFGRLPQHSQAQGTGPDNSTEVMDPPPPLCRYGRMS